MIRRFFCLLFIFFGCFSCTETGVKQDLEDPPLFTMECLRQALNAYCVEDVDVELISGLLKLYYLIEEETLEEKLYLCGENLHLDSGALWIDTLVNHTMGDTYACASIAENSALISWGWISSEVLFMAWENHYLELLIPACYESNTCHIVGEVRYYNIE
tara:strand:- start:374 stop:850 length:477 start_codon:yes stop_codon:yes gene_type:complete